MCRQAFSPSVLGILVGLSASFGVRQVVGNYLSQIPSDDGPTYIVVAVLTLLAVFLACAIPARRATHLNPMERLRSE
jgi:putative ABC transport system permease protein